MTTQTRYSQHNVLTVFGRIYHAEIVENNGQRFLSVSVISTATTDGTEVVYKFTNSNGLLALHEDGFFNKGREVTVTGHIADVSQVYTERKTGEVRLLMYPQINLIGATVLEGGLGRVPTSETQANKPAAGTVIKMTAAPAVDETPELTKEEAKAVAF